MNILRKAMFIMLSRTGEPAGIPDVSFSKMLLEMADRTPELRPRLAELHASSIKPDEFSHAFINFMCKEIYSIRDEERDIRLQQ